MFPHRFDQYNLLYFLIEHHFRNLKIRRKDFAKLCNLSESAVSNLLNFKHAKCLLKRERGTDGQKPYKTETLNKASNPLGFTDKEKSALIWLLEFDKNLFSQKTKVLEMLDCIAKKDFEKINSERYSLRKIPVELAGSKGLWDNDSANSNFKKQSETLQHRLFDVSKEFGHRMVVSKFPTSATHSENADNRIPLKGKLRVNRFHINICENGYGERHIHSKPTIERYLNENSNCSFLPIEKRREHIQNLINTLSNSHYPNFEVGLADTEPEIELAMRSIDVVAIRTTAREILLSNNPFACGPSYLFIHDRKTVLSCYLDFEREWERIPQQFREKVSVIEWLKTTLEKSVKQKRRKDDI